MGKAVDGGGQAQFCPLHLASLGVSDLSPAAALPLSPRSLSLLGLGLLFPSSEPHRGSTPVSSSLQVRWGQLYERLVRSHLLRWASRTFVLQGIVVGHFYTFAVCCSSLFCQPHLLAVCPELSVSGQKSTGYSHLWVFYQGGFPLICKPCLLSSV